MRLTFVCHKYIQLTEFRRVSSSTLTFWLPLCYFDFCSLFYNSDKRKISSIRKGLNKIPCYQVLSSFTYTTRLYQVFVRFFLICIFGNWKYHLNKNFLTVLVSFPFLSEKLSIITVSIYRCTFYTYFNLRLKCSVCFRLSFT